MDKGEPQEQDATGKDSWDDTNTCTRGGPLETLRSFKDLGFWNDGSDSECMLSNDEEGEDEDQFWCALASASQQECIGLTH